MVSLIPKEMPVNPVIGEAPIRNCLKGMIGVRSGSHRPESHRRWVEGASKRDSILRDRWREVDRRDKSLLLGSQKLRRIEVVPKDSGLRLREPSLDPPRS